jgi:Fe-S cluster assembly protein SufD
MGDTDAVAAIRAAGASAAESMGMPTRKERPWKYMDLAEFDLDGYEPAVEGEFTIVAATVQGLTAVAFSGAPDEAKALIDKYLGSVVPAARSKLVGLHYAFLRGGALVATEANVEAREPIRILREYTTSKQLATPHTLIVAGPNSRINVIEDCRSNDEDMVVLPAVEIIPGPGAEVRYTVIHRWGAKTQVFGEQRTVTERDSAVIGLSVVTGGLVVKSHIESSLTGRGSSSELFGLNIGSGNEHCDVYTIQDHIAPDTRSDLLYKSALKGESRSVYYGQTRVGLGAKNADANQENRNLLLSDMAKADSDPVLEILTNDVIRVSHGATAGPVDEEQLYYLETRGISKPDAEALLVRGFLGQVLDRVPDEALRDELAAVIDEKLEAAR